MMKMRSTAEWSLEEHKCNLIWSVSNFIGVIKSVNWLLPKTEKKKKKTNHTQYHREKKNCPWLNLYSSMWGCLAWAIFCHRSLNCPSYTHSSQVDCHLLFSLFPLSFFQDLRDVWLNYPPHPLQVWADLILNVCHAPV